MVPYLYTLHVTLLKHVSPMLPLSQWFWYSTAITIKGNTGMILKDISCHWSLSIPPEKHVFMGCRKKPKVWNGWKAIASQGTHNFLNFEYISCLEPDSRFANFASLLC